MSEKNHQEPNGWPLTAIDSIAGIDSAMRAFLAQHAIASAEQAYSLANRLLRGDPPTETGDAPVSRTELLALKRALDAALPGAICARLSTDESVAEFLSRHPLGVLPPDRRSRRQPDEGTHDSD
jgi:hypothetical protein